eukprot:gene13157-3952_t
MVEEFERLKATRGAHRSVVTRLEKEAEAIIVSNEWNKERKARLEVIGKLLESKTELLQTLDNEIVGKIDVQGLEADILQSNEIELGIKFVVSKIKSCILEREPSTVIEISQEIYPRPDEEGEGETEPATANQLRTIYDRINVHVRSLEALGITSEHYGSLLIPIIMSRIPAEISLQIARQVSKDVWSIREVMEVIKQEVDAREMSENINVKDQRTPPVQKTRPPFQGTASSFHVKGQNPIQCVFCEGKHYTAECTIVTDLKVRKERLYKSGRCFICLSTRHLARNCDRKRSCRNCGGSHHQSICDGGKGARKDRRNSDIPENHDTRTVTATTQGNVKSNVLLQMARTNAYVEPRNQVPVRILLDLGSQRSYITNELKDKLGLTPISTELEGFSTGEIEVKLHWVSAAGTLNVKIGCVRRLKSPRGTLKRPFYIKVFLFIGGCEKKRWKSSAKLAEPNLLFDEGFSADLDSAQITEAIILIQVFAKPKEIFSFHPELIGGVIIGPYMPKLSDTFTHWENMVAKPFEEISEIHDLHL